MHMLPQAGPRTASDEEYQWTSPDEQTQVPFSRDFVDLVSLASQYDLAVSGDALAYADSIGVAKQLIPLCQVGTCGSYEGSMVEYSCVVLNIGIGDMALLLLSW